MGHTGFIREGHTYGSAKELERKASPSKGYMKTHMEVYYLIIQFLKLEGQKNYM